VERDPDYDVYRLAHDTTQALILDGILGRRWHRVDPARALATHSTRPLWNMHFQISPFVWPAPSGVQSRL